MWPDTQKFVLNCQDLSRGLSSAPGQPIAIFLEFSTSDCCSTTEPQGQQQGSQLREKDRGEMLDLWRTRSNQDTIKL